MDGRKAGAGGYLNERAVTGAKGGGTKAANAADKQAAHAKRVETRKQNASDAKARNSSALEELPVLCSGGGGGGGWLRPRERAHCGDAAAHGRRKDYESEATDEGEVIAHDTWAV